MQVFQYLQDRKELRDSKFNITKKSVSQRLAGNKFLWLSICSTELTKWCQEVESRQCPWMISTWITRAPSTRQLTTFRCSKANDNPLVQKDRLRRWSEDVVDHRLRDSVRLAKLYREGTRLGVDKVKPNRWFKYLYM